MTLPEGWVETVVGEVVAPIETANPGVAPTAIFRYVDIGSIDNRSLSIAEPKEILGRDAPSRARRRIRSGDVLFSTVRPYLKNIAQVPPELDGEFTSTGICVLRGEAGVEPGFLFRRVISQDFVDAMTLASDGTMYPAITDKDVLGGAIQLPPAAEQRRIVAKLGALTARLARARVELDRVPVLAGRLRSAALANEFDPREGDSSAKVGSIAQLINGDRGSNYPNDAEQLPSGYCLFLGTRNVRVGRFDFSQCSYIDEAKHETLSNGTLARGDIVLTIRGTLGNCAVYDDTVQFEPVRVNSAMLIVRPNEQVLPYYLMWALRSPKFMGWIGSASRGTAQPHLRAADIKAAEIRLPSLEKQRVSLRRVETAFARADRMEAEATRARALIDRLEAAILGRAFRGELVPQDPDDEPASVLLDRIRAERAAAPGPKRGRRAKAGADA